jgi:hypothetical protein
VDIPPIDLGKICGEGVLLIVYGKPISVENDDVIIKASYIRFVDKG